MRQDHASRIERLLKETKMLRALIAVGVICLIFGAGFAALVALGGELNDLTNVGLGIVVTFVWPM